MLKITKEEFLDDIDLGTMDDNSFDVIEVLMENCSNSVQSDNAIRDVLNFCFHAARKGFNVKFYNICENTYHFNLAKRIFKDVNHVKVGFYAGYCRGEKWAYHKERNKEILVSVRDKVYEWINNSDNPDILVVFSDSLNMDEEDIFIGYLRKTNEDLFIRVYT